MAYIDVKTKIFKNTDKYYLELKIGEHRKIYEISETEYNLFSKRSEQYIVEYAWQWLIPDPNRHLVEDQILD